MKYAARVCVFAAALAAFADCSARREAPAYAAQDYAEMPESAYAETERDAFFTASGSGETPGEDAGLNTRPTAAGRLLITDSYMYIRIENIDEAAGALMALIEKHNSYTASLSINGRTRDYTIKVPAKRYQSFLHELMNIGKIRSYTETTEDVTMKYFDIESRLQTKKELLKTYQGYLAKANTIEEILSVEERIAELQARIDDAGRQFRMITNAIDYSTIHLELRGPAAPAYDEKERLSERVRALLSGVGSYASTVVIIALGVVVYGIPSILILIALYGLLFGRPGLIKKLYIRVFKKQEHTSSARERNTSAIQAGGASRVP